ncbi:MHYT domain-containing protein [Rhodospirillaceae bacterium SYSU D60014]|uniref:MHYT domain-containing protein n=1 Tax=Virgifigura deserti TaxID=2268457 RepID=UPI000E671878
MSPKAMVATSFDPVLVILSVAIAVFASYTALTIAGRLRATVGVSHYLWLFGASLVMGGGMWSMHFVGMLAFQMPMPVSYDLWLTLLSLALPVVVTAIGFHTVRTRGLAPPVLAAAGLFMGIGVVSMHYTGMSAMRMSATVEYQPILVVASVLIAIIASTVALWLAFKGGAVWSKIAGSAAMGIAIAGMHYTAMAAAEFSTGHAAPMATDGQRLDPALLGIVIAAATFFLLFLTLLSALFDRRKAAFGADAAPVPAGDRNPYSPKFAFLVIILFFATLTGVAWSIAAWSDYNETIDQAHTATQNTSRLVQEHLERAVGEGDLAVRHMLNLTEQLGFERVVSSEPIWRSVRDMTASLPHLGSIWIFDATGQARFTTLQFPPPGEQNVADRPYFRAQQANVRGELLVGEPLKGRITGKDLFNVSRRLEDADGGFAGLVVATFETDYFKSFYNGLNLGPESAIGIFREDGTVVVRQPMPPTDIDGKGIWEPLFRVHLPQSLFGTVDGISPIDRVQRIHSYRKATGLPLVVTASVAKGSALADWRSRLNQSAAFGLLIATVLAALLWFAVRSLQREERSQAAIRAAHADLDRRVQERTAALREALTDKEILFKEVHHRVKNNLQVICSLLNLQSARFHEPAVRQAFDEAYHRVHSISLVHKTLYDQGASAQIDFAAYLRDLCDSLANLYGAADRNISIDVSAAAGVLDLNRAVPIALIVNEVISNALKHAFPDRPLGSDAGWIRIEFVVRDQRFRLSVRDNGIGMPEDAASPPAKSLGLVIINALAQQIEATASFHRDDGTHFELSGPLDPPAAGVSGGAKGDSRTTAAAE